MSQPTPRHPGKFVWFEHLSGDRDAARRFYEALFGCHPFPAKNYVQLSLSVLGGKVDAMVGRTDVPVRVRKAILRGLDLRIDQDDRIVMVVYTDETLAATGKRSLRPTRCSRRWRMTTAGAISRRRTPRRSAPWAHRAWRRSCRRRPGAARWSAGDA